MASSTSIAGAKRKRESPLKFYAVRIGKQPGIYHSWPDCLEQVKGFPKAMFKSFTSLTEAQNYLQAGSSGREAGTTTNSADGKFYAVRVGRTPGVYTNYQDVLDQVTGWKGAKHRVFRSRSEAEHFITEGEEPAVKKAKTVKGRKSVGAAKGEEGVSNTDLTEEYKAGEAPLEDEAEDGFDALIVLDPATNGARYRSRQERERVTYKAVRPVGEAPVRIYTDGSSLGNGKVGAMAGVGVYFGPGDGRNVSEPLSGTKQTNQRAELTAIVRALELAPRDRRVVVVSDSKYAIDCVTDWFANWRKNGWVNASRKPVENRDLIQKILDLLEERFRLNKHRMVDGEDGNERHSVENKRAHWDRGPGGVTFEWVKGHDKDEGNNAADHLAVAGARTAQELSAALDFTQ